MAWADYQVLPAARVRPLCRRFIRERDTTGRVRELKELLQQFGDQQLAEDYLRR